MLATDWCAWFLKIAFVQEVGMHICVRVHPKALIITSGKMWHDMDPALLVKSVLKLLYGSCSQYY